VFEVCVCMCVCLSVRPDHSSQRIYSKFGGNLLRVMTRSVGYIFCVCTQRVRVRAKHAHVCIYLCLDWLSPNLLGLYYESQCTLHVQTQHARVWVCVCVHARSLIFGGILSKFAENILRITTSCMGCVFLIFMHRARVCEHARVVRRSLIFGRILSKFGGNILQTIRS
jgi:hypothetical protein